LEAETKPFPVISQGAFKIFAYCSLCPQRGPTSIKDTNSQKYLVINHDLTEP